MTSLAHMSEYVSVWVHYDVHLPILSIQYGDNSRTLFVGWSSPQSTAMLFVRSGTSVNFHGRTASIKSHTKTTPRIRWQP